LGKICRGGHLRSFDGLGTCTEHGGEPQWRLADLSILSVHSII
jgi:hypothetical protein